MLKSQIKLICILWTWQSTGKTPSYKEPNTACHFQQLLCHGYFVCTAESAVNITGLTESGKWQLPYKIKTMWHPNNDHEEDNLKSKSGEPKFIQ
jgi:hypothetical protein